MSTYEFGLLTFHKSNGTFMNKSFPLSVKTFTIGTSQNADIRLKKSRDINDIHCLLNVDKDGIATLINKVPLNPVQLNGQNVLKHQCLKPGDVFSIMGWSMCYNNDNLSPEILKKAEKYNDHFRLPIERRFSTPAKLRKRISITPQPTSKKQFRRKRSNSFGNADEFEVITESSEQFKTPGRKRSIRISNNGFKSANISNNSALPSKASKTPVLKQGFKISTPKSNIKPTLHNELMLKNLVKTKQEQQQEDEVEEVNESSAEGMENDEPEREIKTPVNEPPDNLDTFLTPATNTSIVLIESPLEETVQVRSKKSVAKIITIQRLTNNDDSITVLDSPNAKTPKSTVPAHKTPTSALKKSKLMSELLERASTSTPSVPILPSTDDVVILPDELSEESAFDQTTLSDYTEESIFIDSSDDLLPSTSNIQRKSMRLSQSVGNTRKSLIVKEEVQLSASKTLDFNEESIEENVAPDLVSDSGVHTPTAKQGPSQSEIDTDKYKTPETKTPILSRSAMKQHKSTVKTVDNDSTPKGVTPASKSRKSLKHYNSEDLIDVLETKSNDAANTSTLPSDNKRRRETLADSLEKSTKRRKIGTNSGDDSFDDFTSFKSDDFLSETEKELSVLQENEDKLCSLLDDEDVAKARRSSAQRKSLLAECSNTTIETVNTSSFIYMAADDSEGNQSIDDEKTKDLITFDNTADENVDDFVENVVGANEELSDNDPPAEESVNESIKTPKPKQMELGNDLSDVEVELLKSPKAEKEAENDLTDVGGEKELLQTPKPPATTSINDSPDVQDTESEDDLKSPKSVEKEQPIHKPQREPKNDLTSPRGVKQLMQTPKPKQKEPENDLTDIKGVKKLLATPKEQKEPENDLTSPRGVKQLMKTPKPMPKEPKNDLTDIKGVKKMLATPKAQKDPENDLTDVTGVKQLLKTPKPPANQPKNDLTDIKGVKKLLATPKAQNEPQNDLTDVEGVEELMKTPKEDEPENDLSSSVDIDLTLKSPDNVKDVQVLESDDDGLNVSGVELLQEKENGTFFGKALRTYMRSPKKGAKDDDKMNIASTTIEDQSINQSGNDLHEKATKKKQSMIAFETQEDQKDDDDVAEDEEIVENIEKDDEEAKVGEHNDVEELEIDENNPKDDEEPEMNAQTATQRSAHKRKQVLEVRSDDATNIVIESDVECDIADEEAVDETENVVMKSSRKQRRETATDNDKDDVTEVTKSTRKYKKRKQNNEEEDETKDEPENDVTSPRVVKQLLKTSKSKPKEPKNDLTDVRGVKKMLATPKAQKDPENDLSDVRGVKQLLKTPKAKQNEPKNDLTDIKGVKKLLATPKVQKEPNNDLLDVEGVEELMKIPEEDTNNQEDDEEAIDETESVVTKSSRKQGRETSTDNDQDDVIEVTKSARKYKKKKQNNQEDVEDEMKDEVDDEEVGKTESTQQQQLDDKNVNDALKGMEMRVVIEQIDLSSPIRRSGRTRKPKVIESDLNVKTSRTKKKEELSSTPSVVTPNRKESPKVKEELTTKKESIAKRKKESLPKAKNESITKVKKDLSPIKILSPPATRTRRAKRIISSKQDEPEVLVRPTRSKRAKLETEIPMKLQEEVSKTTRAKTRVAKTVEEVEELKTKVTRNRRLMKTEDEIEEKKVESPIKKSSRQRKTVETVKATKTTRKESEVDEESDDTEKMVDDTPKATKRGRKKIVKDTEENDNEDEPLSKIVTKSTRGRKKNEEESTPKHSSPSKKRKQEVEIEKEEQVVEATPKKRTRRAKVEAPVEEEKSKAPPVEEEKSKAKRGKKAAEKEPVITIEEIIKPTRTRRGKKETEVPENESPTKKSSSKKLDVEIYEVNETPVYAEVKVRSNRAVGKRRILSKDDIDNAVMKVDKQSPRKKARATSKVQKNVVDEDVQIIRRSARTRK